MNLKNLFKHKLLEERTIKPGMSEDGLVYAVNHHIKCSSIFLYVGGQNDILLGDRWHTITSLCVHNNWLYDGGYKLEEHLGFMIDTITGKDVGKINDNAVFSICSHNRNLYRGGWDGVFEVFSGKRVAKREGRVASLCSHEGILYDGGYYKGMYNTFRNEVKNKKKYVLYLCSGKNGLCGVNYKFNKDSYFDCVIFDVLKGKEIKKIKNIIETVTSMCFYKGELCYGYGDMIIGINDERLRHNKKGTISAMCNIPAELAEQIKHSYKYGFNFNDVQRINPKGFIGYLTDVSPKEERQKIIDQLFNYEHVHEYVIDWLNENEKDIMRKAAFY